ncbi:hypothetical protein MAPG_07857 [Magnaporthiopsis poae ATCC 64411]|uniref:Uncharacterized protein n=1 Tax=Magnaporthiopsis poae (strain ATCC 64411 / 73-15) TaxID=644358 RepID=A0A0C4E5T2_MAGP6|nr:hypothetical protein MAPG_07857 [Magnaporthiopsis poae ATCC 64411]
MRGTALTLALLGLALAAPTEQPIESRQKGGVIIIGEPIPGKPNPSKPGDGCDKVIWEKTGYCIILGPIIPSSAAKARRDNGDDVLLDKDADLKAAIKQAQLELQALQAKKNPTRADLKRIEALKFFIEKTSGVIKIVPPDGGTTVLLPGKMKRQAKSGSPCLVDLEKYAKELQEFLLSFPPWERARIWAQLIQGICGIHVGPITPDPTKPGSPLKPDPVTPGDAA